MSLRPRLPLPLRLLTTLVSYLLAAAILAYGRTWNRRSGSVLLAMTTAVATDACAAVRPWATFEVPGWVAGGQRGAERSALYVVVGRRLVHADVDTALFDRLRRGSPVIVTGEARGEQLRRLAVRVPVGTDA